MILRDAHLHLLLILLSLASFVLAARMLPVTRLPISFLLPRTLPRTYIANPKTKHQEPTSFCKCTCFSNSTIIQLGPPDTPNPNLLSYRDKHQNPHPHISLQRRDDAEDDDDSSSTNGTSSGSGSADEDKKYRTLDCNDCNRKFCLDHQLPKCKGAKEEDVFTTCFRKLFSFPPRTVCVLKLRGEC